MKIPIQTAQIHFQNLSYLIQQVSIFFIKSSKKDNYQLENKEIKNLPPNLEKNRFKGKKHMGIYERKVDMVEPLKAVLISTPMGGLNKGKGRR